MTTLSLFLTCFIFHLGVNSKFLDDFEYSTVMDEKEQFWIGWNILNNTHIEFGLQVNATGWIAVGVSPNGQMPNSDINLAFVDDTTGEAYLYDMYTTTRSPPQLDETQSLTLLDGKQINTTTYIRYIRKIDSCDNSGEDLPISQGTTRFLYAYQYQNIDPPDPNDVPGTMTWHGPPITNAMGTRSINFLLPSTDEIPLPQNYSTVEMTMNNINVPSDHTTYMCSLLELPHIDTEQHIIRFDPVVTPGNEGIVHHFLVYSCPEMYVNKSNIGTYMSCNDYRNMDTPEISCIGLKSIYVWAVGGESFNFPDHVGLSMSGLNVNPIERLQYIMLEIHYDNPQERSDIFDSSGVRIYYTPQLRQYQAGVVMIGMQTNYESMIIPNNLDDTLLFGYCPNECTSVLNTSLLNNETYIFATMLHAHTVGKSIKARHIRNNIELKPIEYNPTYDFNYQQFIKHDPELVFLPKDEIYVECIYNTENRDFITYGGESTREEMCLVFLYMYPKPNIEWCLSGITQNDYDDFIEEIYTNGYMTNDYTVYDVENKNAMKVYNDMITSKQRTVSCITPLDEDIYYNPNYNNPKIKKKYKEINYCNVKNNNKKTWVKNNLKWIIGTVVVSVVLMCIITLLCIKKRRNKEENGYNEVVETLGEEI